MVAFLTALMDGHWLAVFAGWIWNNVFIAGTAGSWSIYTSAFGHAGFLWWCWAFFLLIVAIICIAFVWATTFVLYCVWIGVWVCWIFLWIYYLIGKFIVWIVVLIGHFAVWTWSWLWPSLIFIGKGVFFLLWGFIKLFMPSFFAAGYVEYTYINSKNWFGRNIYPLAVVAIITAFLMLPGNLLGWAIFHLALFILFGYMFITDPGMKLSEDTKSQITEPLFVG